MRVEPRSAGLRVEPRSAGLPCLRLVGINAQGLTPALPLYCVRQDLGTAAVLREAGLDSGTAAVLREAGSGHFCFNSLDPLRSARDAKMTSNVGGWVAMWSG